MASETTSQHLVDSVELEWLAFQYAVGELAGAALESFEFRLMTELAAGEALARAVMLCQQIGTIEHQEDLLRSQRVAHPCSAIALESESLRPRSVEAETQTCIGGGRRDLTALAGRSSLRQVNQVCRSSETDSKLGRQATAFAGRKRIAVLLGSAACLAWMVSWVDPQLQNLQSRSRLEQSAGLAALWVEGADPMSESGVAESGLAESGLDESGLDGGLNAVSSAGNQLALNPLGTHTEIDSGNLTGIGSPNQARQVLSHAAERSVAADERSKDQELDSPDVVRTFGVDSDADADEVPGWMLAAVAVQNQNRGGAPEEEILQD